MEVSRVFRDGARVSERSRRARHRGGKRFGRVEGVQYSTPFERKHILSPTRQFLVPRDACEIFSDKKERVVWGRLVSLPHDASRVSARPPRAERAREGQHAPLERARGDGGRGTPRPSAIHVIPPHRAISRTAELTPRSSLASSDAVRPPRRAPAHRGDQGGHEQPAPPGGGHAAPLADLRAVRDRRAAPQAGRPRGARVLGRGGRGHVPHGPVREAQGGGEEAGARCGGPGALDALLRGHLQHHRHKVRAGAADSGEPEQPQAVRARAGDVQRALRDGRRACGERKRHRRRGGAQVRGQRHALRAGGGAGGCALAVPADRRRRSIHRQPAHRPERDAHRGCREHQRAGRRPGRRGLERGHRG